MKKVLILSIAILSFISCTKRVVVIEEMYNYKRYDTYDYMYKVKGLKESNVWRYSSYGKFKAGDTIKVTLCKLKN